MARLRKDKTKKNSNGANLGFEEKLWQAADKMRGAPLALTRPPATLSQWERDGVRVTLG